MKKVIVGLTLMSVLAPLWLPILVLRLAWMFAVLMEELIRESLS
jgi:hypothetical protein